MCGMRNVRVRTRTSPRVRDEGHVCVCNWMGVRHPSHRISFPFPRSLARLSGHVWSCCALCLDLLVLLSSSSNSSPSAPGIEKISPNHQHQHPVPYNQPTIPPTDLLPTTYRQTDPPPTNHKPRLHSLSSLRPKSSAESHDPGPRPCAHCQPQTREARGSRHPRAPSWAAAIFVQYRVLDLGFWVCSMRCVCVRVWS